MKETLLDIQTKLQKGVYLNEEHVRLSLVLRILQEMEWNIWDPREVNAEFVPVPSEDKTKVDIALFLAPSRPPSVFIEVKAVGGIENKLARIERKLRDYNRNITSPFCIITDGCRWRFYYSQTGGTFADKCFKTLDILEDSIDDAEQVFESFLRKTQISSGEAKHEAEILLQSTLRQKVMESRLPEARRLTQKHPFPPLPDALAILTRDEGYPVSLEEIIEFIKKFNIEEPVPTTPTVNILKPNAEYEVYPNGTPKVLVDVLSVVSKFFRHHDWVRAYLDHARERSVTPETIRDVCTRRLNLNTEQFRQLLDNPRKLRDHLVKKFPRSVKQIDRVFK